ncbi:MAG: glutathione S-transferase family protein [Gammaproteobacteria bacterium]
MKLYDCQMAPNPRRARVFIKEKGLEIPMHEVDIISGDNLKDDYRRVNRTGLVPALELDDGKIICEVPAICRYLETLHPEPNLMGNDPYETAMVEQWERFGEMTGMQAVGEVFRNQLPAFAERGLPGMKNVGAIPALVERGKQRVAAFYEQLEQRLSESEYLASDRYTFADITNMCVVDFASFAEMGIPAGNANTQRWIAACRARPSAQV